jgi:hypothetical protein
VGGPLERMGENRQVNSVGKKARRKEANRRIKM